MKRAFSWATIIAFETLMLGVGCEKKSPDVSASVAPSAASTPAPASAAPSADISDTPPSEARAEARAATEITKANYKAELTKVEKEIGQ